MTTILVDTAAATFRFAEVIVPCAIGRNGVVSMADKREGDGCTPIGRWPVRGALLRSDRGIVAPEAGLPWRWLHRHDGWSDDPADPRYNQPVRLPSMFRAETLWRDDDVYDAIVVLGFNDTDRIAGAGSAIFLHSMPSSGTTAGCIAIERDTLLDLLPRFRTHDMIEIVA